MVILSSPSGVGKTTLTKKIQQKYQTFKISVSHTTRSPRSNEVDGVDYNFVTQIKNDYPNTQFILNGGIDSIDKAYKLSQNFDGIMGIIYTMFILFCVWFLLD